MYVKTNKDIYDTNTGMTFRFTPEFEMGGDWKIKFSVSVVNRSSRIGFPSIGNGYYNLFPDISEGDILSNSFVMTIGKEELKADKGTAINMAYKAFYQTVLNKNTVDCSEIMKEFLNYITSNEYAWKDVYCLVVNMYYDKKYITCNLVEDRLCNTMFSFSKRFDDPNAKHAIAMFYERPDDIYAYLMPLIDDKDACELINKSVINDAKYPNEIILSKDSHTGKYKIIDRDDLEALVPPHEPLKKLLMFTIERRCLLCLVSLQEWQSLDIGYYKSVYMDDGPVDGIFVKDLNGTIEESLNSIKWDVLKEADKDGSMKKRISILLIANTHVSFEITEDGKLVTEYDISENDISDNDDHVDSLDEAMENVYKILEPNRGYNIDGYRMDSIMHSIASILGHNTIGYEALNKLLKENGSEYSIVSRKISNGKYMYRIISGDVLDEVIDKCELFADNGIVNLSIIRCYYAMLYDILYGEFPENWYKATYKSIVTFFENNNIPYTVSGSRGEYEIVEV